MKTAASGRRFCLSLVYEPTRSVTHFLVKLVLAAPDSFCVVAELSQAAVASVSHFFMKLERAAPASFLSVACALQLADAAGVAGLAGAAGVAVWAKATEADSDRAVAIRAIRMGNLL